jgi:transglutaminase-like putative cysteine protease
VANKVSIDKAKSLILLTAGVVMAVTFAVGSSGWTRGLNIITFVGLGSILIGLMLARSILPGLIAHLFSLIIGIGWSFWVTARLLPAHYTWLERWQNLAIRLNSWYEQAIEGGTSYDNLMFILQMGVIVWCVGYLTVWFVFRSGRVWQAIVPGGIVLIMNLYYAPNDVTFWFLIYLFLSLLLIIRFNTLVQETKWRSEGVFFRPDVSFDFLRDGFIVSAVVIGIAWLAPPVVDAKALGWLDEFQGSWQDVQSEWNRLYADLNYRNQTLSVGTFGQSFALGGPRYLTDEPVMDVKVEGIGRYWRATVYDEYNGIGWRNTQRDTTSFGPEVTGALPQYAARTPITQTYTIYRNNTTILYAMSGLISLDRAAKVTYNELSTEEIPPSSQPQWANIVGPLMEEISYIRSNASLDQGESYQVVSEASEATVSQLQEAGSNYPTWVTDRYLQLPPLTERTQQLAQEITAPYDNAFDKTQAVERYLRSAITYNERITAPPPGVDKVDYVLFDLKEAYCDYYASAMVTMLRSVGLPARMAAGFARGTFDSEREVFHVINADAHSWVEVYFPAYGWVEFEPTAAQPSIIRPSRQDNQAGFASGSFPNPNERPDGTRDGRDLLDTNIPIDEENFGGGFFSFNIPWFGNRVNIPTSAINSGFSVIGGLLLLGLIAGALWWHNQQTYVTKNIFNLYEGMLKMARWMGANLHTWQTPYEHAVILRQRLPSYQHEVEMITEDYVLHTFGPSKNGSGPTALTLTHESGDAWRRLRPEMVKMTLKRWLRLRRK